MGNEEMPNEGFDPYAAVEELQQQNKGLQSQNQELSQSMVSSNFPDNEENNLIYYQLDTDKILERIEHFLKGDKVTTDENGTYYVTPKKTIMCKVIKGNDGVIYTIDIEKHKIWAIKDEKNKIDEDGVSESCNFGDGTKILNDKNGELISWRKISILDDEMTNFNQHGVAEFMRILSMYVTKETFLSCYTEERINEIIGDLADALNNFWYCGYEKMGMGTKFKESKYHLMILTVLHTIESCYRRALGGGEQENLRTRSIVTQNQPMGGMGIRGTVQKPRFNPFNKSTW